MTTKELLNSAIPGSPQYIRKIVKSNNETEYKRLKKLFIDNKFTANSFEDTNLNVLTFDWQSIKRDRNWWWQLQSLPFLNWFSNSFELQNDEEKILNFSLCLDAIQCWISRAKQNQKSPLAWHDHAAAFRVRNITNWTLFCHTAGIPISEDPRAEVLASLIAEHLDWLLEDINYSKHTNHGFDQAMIGLTIGLMFARDNFDSYRLCNRERLKDEVTFAFTEEGVHKENSPGYQKLMLSRLKQLRTLAFFGEVEITELGQSYIRKAETFLKVITLPDGYLPMIGDTQGGEKGLLDKSGYKDGIMLFDYCNSGYVIAKGHIEDIGDFFLLIKNCHFSNYHRHDDDLMIFFWCNGNTIFADGGLYSHNEKDKTRIFLRSPLAHCVPFIQERAIRDKKILNYYPKITLDNKKKVIYTESYMFGCRIERHLDISKINKGIIKIKDKSISGPLFINFYFGKNCFLKILKNCYSLVNFTPHCLSIHSTAEQVSFYQGKNVSFEENSVISEKYGSISENSRILFSTSHSTVETLIKIENIGINDA